MKMRAFLVVLALVLLLGGYVVYWACYQREHHYWTENTTLWSGESLSVRQHCSNKAYHFAAGHGYLWGGGDPWQETSFPWKGQEYHWENPYTPIAIQPDRDGQVYLVVYDRETKDYHRPTRFRIYRAITTSRWQEIDPREFPKHLAIQNLWFRDNEREIARQMNPQEVWFRRSLMAKLWNYLEHPDDFRMDDEPSEEFVRQFKEKWIQTEATIR
jgi:hypothetical protein